MNGLGFTTESERQRLRVTIRGAVQGVGFRPFVYRLARELELGGWVRNTAQGVLIEAEGPRGRLEEFLLRLERERPPRSFIQSLEFSYLDPAGHGEFAIRASSGGEKTALVLPDVATCPDCLREVLDPADRRYLYPFTNCTHCGPRFTIIESLPYDRPGTTMRIFEMCADCRAEYEDPRDRRFHAQPNACPRCGPHLELWDRAGKAPALRHEALLAAAEAIARGRIVAVKGIGGFHLLTDARNGEAVERLRRLKLREEKPFALLIPSLAAAARACELSPLEERSLLSPEAPIVLLKRRVDAPGQGSAGICAAVAPGNPYLGLMLPYSPLHHLLLHQLGFPVVATSGNLADEPICTDEREALARIGALADLFLVHNRPIARHVDDSIVRIVLGREQVLRRARGYAPLPIELSAPLPPLLAVGAHLKNTVAISIGRQVFISQHIGDLETKEAFEAFERVIGSLRGLYEFTPAAVVCDEHPDYVSTRYAREVGLPVVAVQHHCAHVLACLAENQITPPVLGVSWDGTGYGADGTAWGGEFLRVTDSACERVAHFRTFPLPGGDKAIKEPRRSALGLLFELNGGNLEEKKDFFAVERAFSPRELGLLRRMLEQGINCPRTSSAGRLFDAVAALAGLRQALRYEGQAAMELEFAADRVQNEAGADESYAFGLIDPVGNASPCAVIDWAPMIRNIMGEIRDQAPVSNIAAKFHRTLAEIITAVARRCGLKRVALSGGCFQNKLLLERTAARLTSEGFQPYWHQRVPPNDGGIALGQIVAAARGWK